MTTGTLLPVRWEVILFPVLIVRGRTHAGAIAELKAEGKCPEDTRRRQVMYLINVVEADHGKLFHDGYL